MRRNRQKYKLYLEPQSKTKIPRQTVCRYDRPGVDVDEEESQTANETGTVDVDYHAYYPVGLSRLFEYILLLKNVNKNVST